MIREHEDIVLTATLATPSVAAVTWLKDGVEIRRSKRHQATSLGDRHTLTVRGAQVLDSAVYSCRVGTESQDFPVQVEGELLQDHWACCTHLVQPLIAEPRGAWGTQGS